MDFLEIIKVFIIGVVEGITEWLPISSTGHMILVDEFLQLKVTPEFLNMFLVVIQLGAILAVLCLFFHKLNPFSPKKNKQEKQATISLWGKVIVACLPAAIIGLPLNDFMETHLSNSIVVSVALIVYGVVFILLENHNKHKSFQIQTVEQISYKTALLIGAFQVLSLIPGTSRSGSTILGAMILGANRTVSAEFSFFLAIPVMFGASFLKILKHGLIFTGAEWVYLIVGLVTAFVVSALAIKFLVNFVKKHDFKPFGYYRIILGIIVLLYFFIFK